MKKKKLRVIHNEERKKRGCLWCADQVKKKCPYEECPYHELDKYENYSDYVKANGGSWLSLILKGLGKKDL